MVRIWVNESSILGLSRTDFGQWLLDGGSVIPAPNQCGLRTSDSCKVQVLKLRTAHLNKDQMEKTIQLAHDSCSDKRCLNAVTAY